MIHIKDVSVTYHGQNEPTLRHINLEIQKGEFVLVCGPSGCGKSSLMLCLNGIIQHASSAIISGEVKLRGVDIQIKPLQDICKVTGSVFQNPAVQLCTGMVETEVAFGLENQNMSRATMHCRIDNALQLTGLEKMRHQKVQTLSGGQQQRLAIACALALEPEVLLLDEPTSQLDPVGAQEILKVISTLKDKRGITVVLIEHRLEVPLQLADRVIIMECGEIVHDCAPEEVLADLRLLRRLGLQTPSLPDLFDRLGRCERPMLASDAPALETAQVRQSAGLMATNVVSLQFKKLVRINDLTFSYSKKSDCVLQNVSFDIAHGDRIALLGGNGAGKSTLLLLLAGILKIKKGSIVWPSRKVPSVGMVMQNPDVMLFSSTVEEELLFAPRQQNKNDSDTRRLVEGVMSRLSLDKLRERAPFALSRGERQRTAVGSILSRQASLLLLDEPTTGQDKARIQGMMETIGSDHDAIVFSTHDVETAVKYANRVILMNRGYIVANGPVHTVLKQKAALAHAGVCLSELQRFAVRQSLPILDVDAMVEALA